MIKVSDFIAKYLVGLGFRHVYMLTGGGAMHLNHALGTHPQLKTIFNHHEQASAMAAESHARLTGEIPILNVTTGPGGINTLNGVFGAWTDSIPMFILSGQVRYDTTIQCSGLNVRQVGDQEGNIIECVKSITKYVEMVTEPDRIQYCLQKAYHTAVHGRPGPVWLDIPMDVQGAMVDETRLPEFNPRRYLPSIPLFSQAVIDDVLAKIKKAARPVLLVGGGIRAAKGHELFLRLIDQLGIPVTTAWNAHDAVYDDHPYYIGRPGILGDRAGNFAVQNSDLLLVLGSRLSVRQIGYHFNTFAREAFKIMVDIDPLELMKPTLKIEMPLYGSVCDFMEKMCLKLASSPLPPHDEWVQWCLQRRRRYPTVLPSYWDQEFLVNPYCFMQALSDVLPEDQIIVSGNGTACVVSFQAMCLKKGQRLYTNSGSASMGYDLPAAIGACVASGEKPIICLTGDGSIQQNIQEFSTIIHNRYPIKIFILNNNGYHSIRQTQHNFFGEPLVGIDSESGLGFPDFEKLAAAYGFPYFRIATHAELASQLKEVLAIPGYLICEVMTCVTQKFEPKLSSHRLPDGRIVSKPLEDLAPFLSREELEENMLIPLLVEDKS